MSNKIRCTVTDLFESFVLFVGKFNKNRAMLLFFFTFKKRKKNEDHIFLDKMCH